jgi:AcrR family transcriptional regulator
MEEKILEAAEKLFLDKGFALTTTTEIAKEAGCNQALVHYYFRTKEKLFQKIFEAKLTLFASAFFSVNQQGGTFEERLARKIEAHFDMLAKNPKLPLLLINELTLHPERLTEIKASMSAIPISILHSLESDLKAEIEKGTIRPITIFDLIVNIVSLNVFLFVARPIVNTILDLTEDESEKMIADRRREIVETILRSLK